MCVCLQVCNTIVYYNVSVFNCHQKEYKGNDVLLMDLLLQVASWHLAICLLEMDSKWLGKTSACLYVFVKQVHCHTFAMLTLLHFEGAILCDKICSLNNLIASNDNNNNQKLH